MRETVKGERGSEGRGCVMGEEKGGRLLARSYLLTYRGSQLDDAALLTAYYLLVTAYYYLLATY